MNESNGLSKLSRIIVTFLRYVVAALLAICVVIVTAQVIMRYAVGSPLSWSEVLARMLFIWMMFLSVPIMFYDETYLSFDLLIDSLPRKIQNGLRVFIDVAICAFCIFNAYNAAMLILNTKPTILTPNVQVPYVVMYASVLISMVLSSIVSLDHLRVLLKRLMKKEGTV